MDVAGAVTEETPVSYPKHLLPALAALCALPATGQAATLLNENFNELTPLLSATSVGAFSAIDGTNVDIVGGALFGSLCVTPASGNCIDMDGSGGMSQGILRSNSAFTLQPGVNYYLSFDLLGSQRGITASTTVTFGPYDTKFTLTSLGGTVVDALVTVSKPTSAYLTFTSNTPGDVGNLLDNVSITSSPRGVPEPATLGLMALGFAGVGLARRKRRG
jgi:hypothetical protein